jgi:FKBP-type peptidyl-prolyl cis-trans isomerase
VSCNSKYPGFKQTDNGLYYKFHVRNKDAQKPSIGDIVTVNMVYRIKDSILFDSKSLPEAFRFPLDSATFNGDIFEGLAMMGVGDSATFIVPGDSLKRFGNLNNIDTGEMIYFDVKLLNVQPKAEFEKEMAIQKQKEEAATAELRKVEEADLNEYITKNNIKTAPSESGLYFINIKSGSGVVPENGKIVEIHYTATKLNGDKVFSSRDESGKSIFFELGQNFEIPAIEEALLKMKTGSKVKLIVPSKLAYGDKGIKDFIPPCTPLIFEMELLSVTGKDKYGNSMSAREKSEIDDYLKKNNISVKPDKYGLYYIETKKGAGARVTSGKIVQVNYTGTLMNGKVFDSSIPSGGPIELQMGAGEVIPGWEIGLAYMNAGGKATFIIPSKLGYGETYNGIIAPYSPLIFDIEVVSVK